MKKSMIYRVLIYIAGLLILAMESYPEYESGTWRISNHFGILQRIGDHTSQFRKYNTCVIHNFRNTGTGFAQYPGKAV